MVLGEGLNVLIIGGAGCVWDDLATIGEWPHEICAVNDIATRLPRFGIWCSLHPREFADLEPHVTATGYQKWSHKPPADHILPDWRGSSGLFAVKVCLSLGFTRIILAGIPMDQQPHFNKSAEWQEADLYRRGWMAQLKKIQPHVRSCSGWTRSLLGGPDQFLQEIDDGSENGSSGP